MARWAMKLAWLQPLGYSFDGTRERGCHGTSACGVARWSIARSHGRSRRHRPNQRRQEREHCVALSASGGASHFRSLARTCEQNMLPQLKPSMTVSVGDRRFLSHTVIEHVVDDGFSVKTVIEKSCRWRSLAKTVIDTNRVDDGVLHTPSSTMHKRPFAHTARGAGAHADGVTAHRSPRREPDSR